MQRLEATMVQQVVSVWAAHYLPTTIKSLPNTLEFTNSDISATHLLPLLNKARIRSDIMNIMSNIFKIVL